MDISEVTVAGFQLAHLLVAFLIISTFAFILYWMWTWPCGKTSTAYNEENRHERETCRPSQPTWIPLYAMEIEPGTVVLQSEDGEFFRILREYDAADKTGNGSTSPELASSESGNRYLLSYTRAHFQTRPSAPLYPCIESEDRGYRTGGSDRWQPINTLNSHSG